EGTHIIGTFDAPHRPYPVLRYAETTGGFGDKSGMRIAGFETALRHSFSPNFGRMRGRKDQETKARQSDAMTLFVCSVRGVVQAEKAHGMFRLEVEMGVMSVGLWVPFETAVCVCIDPQGNGLTDDRVCGQGAEIAA